MKLLSKNIVIGILIFFLLASLYSILSGQLIKLEEISLSALVEEIKKGEVEKISVKGERLEILLVSKKEQLAKKETESSLIETLRNYGLNPNEFQKINVEIKQPSGVLFWLGAILPFLLPFIFIIFFFWLMAKQVSRANIQAFTFGQTKARVVLPSDKKNRVTFNDVAGVKEAKEELKEVVDFLRNPQKFLAIGAQIPKGVLLLGAPGTGKTLLARAVAGEANVPFFYMSASEFVEMFVGIGASRVRDTFSLAKKSAPAIIFIDEIDAIGRQRGAGLGGGHDEREQTLNQILVELDGFEPNERIIVLAATNRPDILDTALLRPGRFDRRVILDPPDLNDREAILKIHARGKIIEKDVDLRRIAERTPGFSGADLKNIMNESAILAARHEHKAIRQIDLYEAIEKVLLGPERKSFMLNKNEKKIAAYHEAGHALVAAGSPNADPVHKISIIARGRAAGYTLKLPLEEKRLLSKKYFLDELAVALGGYASEKLIFGELTTGAADDLKKVTELARNLVTKFGMSEKIGPMTLGNHEELIFLGREIAHEKNYSEEVAKLIDREISRFIKEALKQAESILKKYKKTLDAIAGKLMEKETIEREEFEKLIVGFGFKPKTVQSAQL
ncbi:MAG: cell division protein FtsH [Candidatus Niyogibacteria bacterium RIFCSPLOWO2_12_FULL_41_13]|uniref:ATP-dependent zinc metalloprotease FtsH n=1 Tax=Candidatus Niyogibacteria bacterium RIFCSPLOWO2_12_FULL_41_13 TaxID=1801726 RepID=A0A1G2F0A3_9BACT|nr:MAG: cell division protein FtsH [Candidatus Niyogibacteria bacterium RIFCSPLOWO2_12_FULL_41_13]